MIVVTGAAGFIGSCLVRRLNDAGYPDILVVDEFSRPEKMRNLEGKKVWGQVHRNEFVPWLERHHADVDAVFHIGARTDTTELSTAIFDDLNLNYSKALWTLCAGHQIPFYYASSAATYGLGESGYSDDHALIPQLKPLNPYGQSKQDFDMWVLETVDGGRWTVDGGRSTVDGGRSTVDGGRWTVDGGRSTVDDASGAAGATSEPSTVYRPPSTVSSVWAGFKFFNVYGPNEYHKGRMASVIFHTARQIKSTGGMKLFRSHRPDFRDGEQSRDFIYVKDVVDVLLFFLEKRPASAIYNLGTGQARTFLDLATNTFTAMGLEPNISFIDTPADIRDTYQYFTQADMTKLRQLAGYNAPFYSLEDGISDYVGQYLKEERIW